MVPPFRGLNRENVGRRPWLQLKASGRSIVAHRAAFDNSSSKKKDGIHTSECHLFVIAESLATRFALIYNLFRLSTLGLYRRLIKAIKS